MDDTTRDKQVVFLSSVPFGPHHAERFGFAYLRSRGLDVVVVDYSRLVGDTVWMPPEDNDLAGATTVSPATPSELVAWLGENCARSHIVLLGAPMVHDIAAVHALLQIDEGFGMIQHGAIPWPAPAPETTLERWRRRAGRALDRSWWRYQRRRRRWQREGLSSELAKRTEWVLLGAERDEKVVRESLPALPASCLRYGHAPDVDRYLQEASREPLIEGRYAVFLDQYIPHHPDNFVQGRPVIESDDYYRAIRRLLDHIEAGTGIRGVVAAHPKAEYQAADPRFGGRELHRGASARLAVHAELVVTHNSTAVSFAVLAGKPVLTVTTPALENHFLGARIAAMAEALGTSVLHLDDEAALAAVPWDCPGKLLDGQASRRFEERFVRHPRDAGGFTWERIAEQAESEFANRNRTTNPARCPR